MDESGTAVWIGVLIAVLLFSATHPPPPRKGKTYLDTNECFVSDIARQESMHQSIGIEGIFLSIVRFKDTE